jgi:HEAT repeat protein
MPIRQFEPRRAVEIIAPSYGSGYRLGGRLLLTAAHLVDDEGSECEVRDIWSFGKEKGMVVYRRKDRNLDIALIELPEKIEEVEAIALGKLPKATVGEKLAFQMYGYPLWAQTQREQGSAAGGRQVEGIIFAADRSPDGFLVLEAERLPPESTTAESEWAGASGAAIICDGLVVAVQSRHQNPRRPASLEASPLWMVDADDRWRQLLGKHHISPEPEIVRIPTAETILDISWHEVSLKLLEKRFQLTTSPITRREDIDYSVEQMYIPLGLVERKKVPRHKGDGSPERGSDLYGEDREEEVIQKFEYGQFLEQVLHQGQSPKSQGKRVAIIGEPGSGKTTLLQQIARWVSSQFPASVIIWISLADLEKKNLRHYIYENWLTSVVEQHGQAEVYAQAKNSFIAQSQQGHVWLLLDGLDEMPLAGNPLDESGWLDETRCVLTCRLNLWTGKPLAGFDVFRTLEFSYPQQVEKFVARWFVFQGKADLGQSLCTALEESGRERIRDLVKNPLRLTLLCFDWGLKEGGLPATQAELYHRFVDHYYYWKAEEFPAAPSQRQALNRGLAQLSLAAIDDRDEKGQARFRLRYRFVQRYLKGHLFDLALQLGWLNQVGVDADDPTQAVYAFYHPTFQEYFAALAIDDWGFFLPRQHRNRPVKDQSYRIFQPQWKQVFLLWLGREDSELKSQKVTLIQALLAFKDGCREFYSDRAYLLAAAGIAEFKDCTCADEIVYRLVQWQHGPDWLKWWVDFFFVRRAVRRRIWAQDVIQIISPEMVIQALVRLLESTQYRRIRRIQGNHDLRGVAETLCKIGTSNEAAIRALVRMLEFTHDRETRFSAAKNLCNIGSGNEIANQAMVRMLESTKDRDTRRRAAVGLGQIGTGNQAAIRALVRVIESTRDVFVQLSAAESLGRIGTGNEMAIRALVGMLFSMRWLVSIQAIEDRMSVAESLGKIDPGNAVAIRVFVHVLESTCDKHIRRKAIEGLGEIGSGNETAIRALVRELESTQDYRTSYLIVKSLSKIGTGNERVIQVLLRELKSNQYENLRWEAAEALWKVDPGNESAIGIFVHVIESTQYSYHKCWEAADTLWNIDPGNEAAIRAFVRLMKSDRDFGTRQRAAESLSEIDPGNETATRALVLEMESTHDDDFCWRAAETLWKVDPGNEAAIRALVRILEYTQCEFTRWRAAESLWQIEPGNETAMRALVRVLESTQDEYTLRNAAESLGKVGKGNEAAIQALVRVMESTQHKETLTEAAISLGKIGSGNETAIRALVRLFESTQYDSIRDSAAYSLSTIDLGNETAMWAVRLNRNRFGSYESNQLLLKCAETLPYPAFYQAFHTA